MRTLFFSCFFLLHAGLSNAQQTIVKGAVNDTLNLQCGYCRTKVLDLGVYKGTPTLPYNIQTAEMENLLHWRYFDGILGRDVTTSTSLPWETCTQLFDTADPEETVSLHINVQWQDSTGYLHRFNLMAGGLYKSSLERLPLLSDYTTDTGAPERFMAIAQMNKPDGKIETYEIVDGWMEISAFDPRTGALSGTFEFTGNCYGLIKKGFFSNGTFSR